MARNRVPAARRKQQRTAAHEVADGVYHVAKDIMGVQHPLPLWMHGPLRYVSEQMASALCKAGKAPAERYEEVADYLTAGMLEYATAVVGEFDVEHMGKWLEGMVSAEQRATTRGGVDSG